MGHYPMYWPCTPSSFMHDNTDQWVNNTARAALLSTSRMYDQTSFKRSCNGGEPRCTFKDHRKFLCLCCYIALLQEGLEGFLSDGLYQVCMQCPRSVHAVPAPCNNPARNPNQCAPPEVLTDTQIEP